MGKNRNKSLRDITVGGRDYKWLAEIVDNSKYLKIWIDKNNLLYEGFISKDEVTPLLVSEIINEVTYIK